MILVEERNSVSMACVGLTRAIPPNLAGRAKRSLSVLFGGGLPVSAGISLVLIVTSRGRRLEPMLGMVRVRHVHLRTRIILSMRVRGSDYAQSM